MLKPRREKRSTPRDVVGGHLGGVPHEETPVGDRGIVPGLALQRGEARDFGVLIRRRLNKRQVA